jgi:hypothetical protein
VRVVKVTLPDVPVLDLICFSDAVGSAIRPWGMAQTRANAGARPAHGIFAFSNIWAER